MNLHNVVRKFLTETFTDPYNPTVSLVGGIRPRPFNEVSSLGPTSRRKIFEARPDVVMFDDHVITRAADGSSYIVGIRSLDFWRGEPTTAKYQVLPCDTVGKVVSIYQIVTSTLPSRNIYVYPHYVRGIAVEAQSSQMDAAFSLYMPKNETGVTKGKIVIQGTNYFKMYGLPYVDGAEFLVVACYLLDSPVQTMTYVSKGGYDPITDTIVAGTTTSKTVFVEEAFLAYDHSSPRAPQVKAGDKAITLALTTAPRAGDVVGSYDVVSVESNGDGSYNCHCRRR